MIILQICGLKDALFHDYKDFPNYITEDSDDSSRNLAARSQCYREFYVYLNDSFFDAKVFE